MTGGGGEFSGAAWGSGAVLASQGKLVTSDALSADAQKIVQQNVAFSKDPRISSVLVGVLCGAEEWDLRPLLLETSPERGRINLVRVFEPAVAVSDAKRDYVHRVFSGFSALAGDPLFRRLGILAWDEREGHLWVRRKFFPSVLRDRIGSISLSFAVQLAQKLLHFVSLCHQKGLVHGHICPENIAVEDDTLILLDFAFCACGSSPASQSLAPELRMRGEVPTPASDIYGLGEVLDLLFSSQQTPEMQKLLSQARAASPEERPSLEELMRRLFPTISKSLGSAPRTVLSGDGTSTVRTGKIISASASPGRGADSAPRSDTPQSINMQEVKESKGSSVSNLKTPRKALRKEVVIFSAGLLIVGLFFIKFFLQPSFKDRVTEAELLWGSKSLQVRKELALRAIKDDDAAQFAVVSGISNGRTAQPLRTTLLQSSLNPSWEEQLTAEDRQIIFSLALAPIVAEDMPPLPEVQSAHPGVLLGIVGDLALSQSEGKFKNVPLKYLSELPAPQGLAFGELAKLGVQSLGDLPARALCRLLVGDGSRETLVAYLGSGDAEPEFLTRLLIIIPFTELYPKLAEGLSSLLMERGDVFSRRLDWFRLDPGADWQKIGQKEKLFFSVGMLPETTLSFEQYADLLTYPAAKVRSEVVGLIAKEFPKGDILSTLQVLSSENNFLSRPQNLGLMVTLRLREREPTSDTSYSLVSRWFQTAPEVQTILGLLVARNRMEKLDPFNIEAARYLAEKGWNATIEQLTGLVSHTEPLARALAYSRLDPAIPAERTLLEYGAKNETVPRIKQDVIDKLKPQTDAPALEDPEALLEEPL